METITIYNNHESFSDGLYDLDLRNIHLDESIENYEAEVITNIKNNIDEKVFVEIINEQSNQHIICNDENMEEIERILNDIWDSGNFWVYETNRVTY